jgi:molecular chaperone GrpE
MTGSTAPGSRDGHEWPASTGTAPPPDDAPVVAEAPQQAVADDDRLLRAMADLDNLRKRFYREVTREREAERARVAAAWLPIVDDLDRALEHLPDKNGVTAGVRAVRDHALAVMAGLGFPRFEPLGERFDPVRHEAVRAIEADAPAGTVVAVVRPGYGSHEVILRPAGVVVAREPERSG